mmetsp:Transcript_560/g.1500  ORF Transcript_560/g.1500 Transcript_560/m.1500 type:complete len:214 (+) Transcript_560:97-738(+)
MAFTSRSLGELNLLIHAIDMTSCRLSFIGMEVVVSVEATAQRNDPRRNDGRISLASVPFHLERLGSLIRNAVMPKLPSMNTSRPNCRNDGVKSVSELSRSRKEAIICSQMLCREGTSSIRTIATYSLPKLHQGLHIRAFNELLFRLLQSEIEVRWTELNSALSCQDEVHLAPAVYDNSIYIMLSEDCVMCFSREPQATRDHLSYSASWKEISK